MFLALLTSAFAGPAICSAPVEHFIDSSGFHRAGSFPQTEAELWTWTNQQLQYRTGKLPIKADVCCPAGQHATGLQTNTWVNVQAVRGSNGVAGRWDFSFNALYCAN